MRGTALIYLSWTLCPFLGLASSQTLPGVVLLDYLSLNKTLARFPYSLVKFDGKHPEREKHTVYGDLGEELSEVPEILVAEVRLQDGDKQDDRLRERFNIERNQYPEVFLFNSNDDDKEPTRYGAEFTTSQLKTFLKHKTQVFLKLPGCIREFDELAGDFARNSPRGDDRQKIAEKAKKRVEAMGTEEEYNAAAKYIKLMEMMLAAEDGGEEALEKEENRVTKLIKDSKMSSIKVSEMKRTLNVIKSFQVSVGQRRDEL